MGGGGGGAVSSTSDVQTGGQWAYSEKEHHINYLELLACFLGLKALCSEVRDKHIRVNMDNTVSCAYIAHYGGKKKALNTLAIEIWQWARERNIWLSSGYIQGAKNTQADELSRKFNDDCESNLSSRI